MISLIPRPRIDVSVSITSVWIGFETKKKNKRLPILCYKNVVYDLTTKKKIPCARETTTVRWCAREKWKSPRSYVTILSRLEICSNIFDFVCTVLVIRHQNGHGVLRSSSSRKCTREIAIITKKNSLNFFFYFAKQKK